VNGVSIFGRDDVNDTLVLEATPLLATLSHIDFHGGDRGFDTLVLESTGFDSTHYTAIGADAGTIALSALTGEYVDTLLELITGKLPEAPAWYDTDHRTDRPLEFRIRERIREQIILHTKQEVPHAIAVIIEDWSRRQDDRGSYIRATIVVERPTQKAIIIGKSGSMLKRIGQAAREELETLLGEAVFLELWVKVMANWRNDDRALRRLGYGPQEI